MKMCLRNDHKYKLVSLIVLKILFIFFTFNSAETFSPIVWYDVLVMRNGFPEKDLDYRIPIIAQGPIEQTLLVVVEQRNGSNSDQSPKNIAYSYSQDNGLTWSDVETIFQLPNDGNIFLGNIVIDYDTNKTYVIFTVCFQPCRGIWTNYISESVDDGKTWSAPRNISNQIGTFEYCGGPSLGIQKKYSPYVGRLIACGHTEPSSIDGVYCIYSDDHGETWTKGSPLLGIPYNATKQNGDFLPDEATIVELPNGEIMVNARNQNHYHCNCRLSMISKDGAQTFPLQYLSINEDLPDSACAAGLAMFKNNVLLFTNPNSTTSRVNLTLRWSTDLGKTWDGQFLVWPSDTGYSTLTYFQKEADKNWNNDRVYIAYEKSNGQTHSINIAAVDMN